MRIRSSRYTIIGRLVISLLDRAPTISSERTVVGRFRTDPFGGVFNRKMRNSPDFKIRSYRLKLLPYTASIEKDIK